MLSTPNGRKRMPLASMLLLALGGWAMLNLAVVMLAPGFLPFDRPALMRMPFALQVAMPSLGMLEQFALMALVAWLCRGKEIAGRKALLPGSATASNEIVAVLTYAALAQAAGWIVPPALGMRPFSFHLAGSVFGCSIPPSPSETLVWAAWNFVAFALIPGRWFARKYGAAGLWLVFDRKGHDLRVLMIVLVIESAVQVAAMPAVLGTPLRIWLLAGPIAFLLSGLGTVLPTMILVCGILVPRYWQVTGSRAAATLLGGLTYAAMHLVEGWSNFSSPSDSVLSLLFVFLSYTGPGMFKSYVTLRTGNAWIHALGYHAVAPHTLFDTPLFARIFAIS